MDKLYQFGPFLQRPDLDPLFKSLSATQTNWFELQNEIQQIVRCSGARTARENIVASALSLVTKYSSLKESVPSTESTQDALKDATIKKAIDTIRSLNENVENDTWTTDIQEEITRYLSVLEDDELMASWLSSDFLKSSQPILSSAQSNEVGVSQKIAHYCIEHGGLLRHLLLLVVFSQSEDLLTESFNGQFILDTIARRKNDALSYSELATFSEKLKSLESTKLCEGTPRINIFCGTATKYSRYEIHGAVGASVVGLNQLTVLNPSMLYFEVALKSKEGDLSHIRFGWGSQCTHFSSISKSGQDDTHWLIDIQTGRIVHDEKSNEIELSSAYDIADLFGADDEEDTAGTATPNARETVEGSVTQSSASPPTVFLQASNSDPIQWDSGIISCVYNFLDSTALYFINGEYIGQFSTNHNWTELDKRDLAPFFVGNSSSSFSLNLGQQPYQFLSQVSAYLSGNNFIDMKETDIASQIEKQCAENLHSLKYLSINSYADKESGRGFFSVKDVTQDAIKTFTLEMSVRVRSEYDGIDRVLMQTSPFSDGSLCDGSLTLGIGAQSNIFFIIAGCGIVETPKDSLPRNLWFHLAVTFFHFKGSGKVQVNIFVNGQNSVQLELTPEKNAKNFKISIKQMQLGSPLPTEERKPFVGDLSNIRLWGNARSGDKISSLMHKSKLGGHESDLLLFIPCDEGYGIEVHDCSSSRNPARRQERLFLQGDCFWGTMTTESWLAILDSIRSGWSFSSYSSPSVDCIHLLTAVLHRIEILHHKFDEYFVHGWNLSDFKKNGLSLATYLSDHNSVSFELIKSLLVSVLRRIATGVESKTQSAFEKLIILLFAILERGLQYLQHLSPKESISCCPVKLRSTLFMIIIFVSNGCSFLTDQASIALSGKALELLSRFVNQCIPDPKERLVLLQNILDHRSKSIDEVRPLGIRRSSSMDGGYNVQAFVKLDFSQALYHLKQDIKTSLYAIFCSDASTLSTLSSLITPSLRPRSLAAGSTTASIKELAKSMSPCKNSLPDHGDFVRRGNDWKYGDEDGNGVGVVLSLAKWKEQADAAVIVLWENNHIGKYRCGYRPQSDRDVEIVHDVNVLVDSNEKENELHCEPIDFGGDEQRKTKLRSIQSSGCPLKPSSVVASLLSTQDFVNPSISKRTVLSYMQENGDSTWVEAHDLMSSINDLVAKFSNFHVCLLFGKFLQHHEGRFMPQLNSSVSTEEEASVENKSVLSLLFSIIRSIESDIVQHNDSSMCIVALNAFTALLYGAVGNGSQRNETITVSYNPSSFGNSLNSNHATWDWTDCNWTFQSGSDSNSLKSTASQGKDRVIDTFPISRIPSNIQVRHRGRGLELSVQGDREWSTVVFDSPMLANTGVYRWYAKVKFSERRGQVLVGLCTDKFYSAKESQLGVSDQSWGISPNFDIYHDGRKRKLSSDSHKLSSGSILEFVVDTDLGTLQISELGAGSVVNRYGKDSEYCISEKLRTSVLFPAISLSHPGDSALFVGDSGDIKVVQARMGTNEGNSASKDKGSPVSIFLGCPKTVSLDCFSAQLFFFSRIIEKNLENIENLANISLNVGTPLMLSLASLRKWGHFAPASRVALTRSLVTLIKQLLGTLSSLDSFLSIRCEESQANAIADNLQQWRMLLRQLLALTIELLGKAAIEMARIPTLGSYFNELLDVGGNLKIESSSSMKSAYSKALAGDVFIQGVNENPFTIQPSEVVIKWIESFVTDTNFQGCEDPVSLLIQSTLFHIGMESLCVENKQKNHDPLTDAITNALVDQVQLFIKQFRTLSESSQLSVVERMRLVARCVRSPMQASISLQDDDLDGALVSILKTYSDEILSLVFCEYLNCSVLESLMVDREMQANCKADAFELMRTVLLLLEGEQFLPFYTIFLDQIAVALNSPYEIFSGIFRDNSGTSPWHYFDGLNAASLSSAKRLRTSFSSLISHLISNMSNVTGGDADRLLVSLIGVLATKVTVFDHANLARNNFFAALEELMEDQNSSSQESGTLRSKISSAATKLFIMMALQIASGGKKVSKDRTQQSPIMQRAFTLERMRSGPATLNRSVFDLVYRLLLKAVSRSFSAKSESLFECVTILLNIAVDEDSQKIIATPDWVKLLVNVAFSADMKYRQRAMAVLVELIPSMNCSDQEWSSLAPLLTKWGVSSFVEVKGKDIPLCLILHIIGKFVTVPLSLSTSFPFVENGEKVIDQYQQVMSLVTESITLYRTLLVSENEWRNASLGLLEKLFQNFCLSDHTIAVDESILGALAVYDGYLVCSHLYSMVACPLSGEIFVGVITGYVDSSKERVEASGILVSPETLHWKYDRKQDLKKMVAGASVLLPIQKVLPCMLPISNSLVFGAMKVFFLIDRWHTSRLSELNNLPVKSETKLETEIIETKEDEIKDPFPSFSIESFEFFRSAFAKFLSCIYSHPRVSGNFLCDIANTEEFRYVWQSSMLCASQTCRASDMGMFSNLEEHFHDLAVMIGNKKFQLSQKDSSASAPAVSSDTLTNVDRSTAPLTPSSTFEPRTPIPEDVIPEAGVPPVLVDSLTSMGFPRPLCITALQRSGGDFEEALNFLLNSGGEAESTEEEEGYDMTLEDEAAALQSSAEERKISSVDEHEEEEEEEEGEEQEVEKSEYHYVSRPGRALPFHIQPSFHAERMGCLFPGDDVHVVETREIDGVKWLQFHMSDFDGSHYASSYGEDFYQFMVWVPSVVNGEQVIREGLFQNDIDIEFSEVVFDPVPIDRCYRVTGSNGMLVRVGKEIGTDEVATLDPGTFIHACEESFNIEGTVRMFIDQPVRGWVSKLLELVERVPSEVAKQAPVPINSQKSVDVNFSEYDIQIEDNMDSSSGHDIFSKEDRFFASMQGRRFEFLERAEGSKLLNTTRRRKLLLPSSSTSTVTELQTLLLKTLSDIGSLMFRKCLILAVCHLTSVSRSDTKQSFDLLSFCGDNSSAEMLMKCIRLLLFRGELSYMDGIQRFLFSGGDYLTALKQPVSVEDALVILADRIVSKKLFDLSSNMENKFRHLFLTAIQKSIVQACESRYSDHSWEDSTNEASADSDILSSPSINYALWLTLVLAKSQNEEILMKLVVTWVQAVKASSMSLKCIAYRVSSHLLELARNLSMSMRSAIHMHIKKIVSLRRLSLFAVKRLWQEMEDAPQYSRFMQSLTALLFQITDVFSSSSAMTASPAEIDESAARNPIGQMMTLNRPDSHVQFTSQKDLSSPWSLRIRLRRRKFIPEQYEPYLQSGNDTKLTASSTANTRKKFADILKLLTGEGMEERMSSMDPSGSQGTSLKSNKLIPGEYHLNPSYLLYSSRAFIKIQKGGRTFVDQVLDDELANSEPVNDEALCFSFGGQGSSEERVFDVVLPYDKWLDLMIVCDQNAGVTSLYVDGQYQDSASFTMNLPLAALGSPKPGLSFAGDISHFQVWNYAKSMMEVTKDCCAATSFTKAQKSRVVNKPLINLVFSAESLDGLFDEMGTVTGLKSNKCMFLKSEDCEGGPSLSMLLPSTVVGDASSNSSFLVTASNVESPDFVELTGYVRVPKSGKKPPLSNGIEEIIVLQYRVNSSVDHSASDSVGIHGFLTWSDYQVKIEMKGSQSMSSKKFILQGNGSDVISGPPEKIAWLRCITFSGEINDGSFVGDCFLDLKLDVNVTQSPGSVRLELNSLPSSIEASCASSASSVKDVIKVNDGVDDGQYIAYCAVQPYLVGEYLSYGMMKDQGSLWIDWHIKASSGNIAFGWTKHSALSHPDASVDANLGTWTYSTSGQASHGADLYLCDSADEGDIVSFQINTHLGRIRVFKNYELILVFENICDDSMMSLENHQLTEVGKLGIRPFVSLVSSGDCVQLLGVKDKAIEITFPESDAYGRCKFLGSIVNGNIDGYGLVSKDTNSRWEFGLWKEDEAMNVHIEIADILAEEIEVKEVRRYSHNELIPASVNEDTSVTVQLLIQQFCSFRSQHVARGCSLFSKSSRSIDESMSAASLSQESASAVESSDTDAGPTLSVRVCAHAHDIVPFTLSMSKPLASMLDSFAARNDAYREAFVFKLGEKEITADDTPESAGLTDGCCITAITKSFTYDESIDDPVSHYFPNSTAPYIVMIIYEGGATVRNRIEIDDNSLSLRIIRKGEIVEAFRKTMTSDGIGRFKISDGWISERLRGGTEEPVVRILKQRFQLTSKQQLHDLPQYKVLREEGAKLRAGASFKSEDLGFCPQNTTCYVDEKRMTRNEAEGNSWTSRIHICSPATVSGWISDKDKLIEKISDGAFANVDPAVQMELARRNKLRTMKRSNVTLGRPAKHQVQLIKLNAEVSLSTELPFLLKKSRHCENLSISKDFTTVTCPEGGSGRQIVLGSKGFAHGIHYWEVHVKAANWGTVFIGVAPEDASGWNGLGFINYRATQAFGSETLYGNYYGVNDKIGVLLDMDRGTLTFFKDGEDFNIGRVTVVNMGVAYHNVRKSASRHSSSSMLYPCFGVKTSGDSLSIKDTHWMSYSGLDSTQSMQRAMQALSFAHAWKDAYASNHLSISPAGLQVMYDDYGQKCSPNFFTTDARPGLPVQLLVSHDALLKAVGESLVTEFGLHVGCNLSTVYGPASLLGVSFLPYEVSCRVWYSCEKNGKRAWYWTLSELQNELQAKRISVLSELLIPISHRQESFNAIDQDIRLSQDAFDRLLRANVLPSTSSFPSFPNTPKTPSAMLSTAATSVLPGLTDATGATGEVEVVPWTYFEDCQLAGAVNQVAIRHDHDACTLSAHMVQHYLEQQQLLSHRTPTEIHVRYTALCLLNRCIAIALPLLDLSLADVHKSLFVPIMSSSHTAGLAYGRNLQSIPSPLRDLVLSVKQIIFTQTKMQFWSFAVRETTVSTALPADEYERPDEIREITINTLKAKHFRSGLLPATQQWEQQELMFERIAHYASLSGSGSNNSSGSSGSGLSAPSAGAGTVSAAATTAGTSTNVSNLLSDWMRDMDERLKMSVFGQLLEAFNGWDDRVLCKAYVHMQDAGQARAFFVKLAGEGVDDQGGPYRAVFQQAIGEEITHLFPLLAPTDNHVHGLGQQRDKFNFNLALLANHPKGVSLLVHLGKLVGVAVRHRIQVPLPLTAWLYQTLCFESVSVTEAMMQSNLSLVNSLRSLSDVLKDVKGEIFGREDREEAAEFLVEALLKIVKKLQTTSRAVWTSLMTSAISSGNSGNSGSSSGGSNSGGSSSSGASFASLTMTLSDISEEKLRGMVSMAAGLCLPSAGASPSSPSSSSSLTTSSFLSEGNAFGSVQEIIDTIFYFHLLAQNEALQLFFKGLAQILPVELFSLFTTDELETVISGTQEVNLDVLQQATVYDDVSPADSHVQMFWDALRLLDQQEQSLFVNFCSGRSRLPASASDFPMPFKITTPPPSSHDNPDRFLPVARTCFFTLSLPKYSSVDVCREKLQYAIRHTEVMDADFVDRRGASAWDQLPAAPPLPATSVSTTAEWVDAEARVPEESNASSAPAGSDPTHAAPASHAGTSEGARLRVPPSEADTR
jgi:hypothetical protein